jgi:hypothetical protein
MKRQSAPRWTLLVGLVFVFVACASSTSGTPSPTAGLELAAVTEALKGAGIAVVDVADNLAPRDGAWRCLPGTFRLARLSQQPPGVLARPGGPPSVEVLIFASAAERAVAQTAIGPDGQVHVQGCATMVEWVGTPHAVGAKNVLLFIATDDPVAWAAVQAAAARLGG